MNILKQFRDNLIAFFDELIQQFPEEGDFVILRIFFKDQAPMTDVMSYMIRNILPLKKQVTDRDSKFFLENNIMFSTLDNTKVNHFKNIWLSNRLDDEDRQTIWTWFDLFVLLTERYQSALSKEKEIKLL